MAVDGQTLPGNHLTAIEPLYQAVIENARNAAVRDPRFAPVQPDEVAQIKIEISVLTEPQPLPLDRSRPPRLPCRHQ